jgi:hypothetical protein
MYFLKKVRHIRTATPKSSISDDFIINELSPVKNSHETYFNVSSPSDEEVSLSILYIK